MSNLRLWLLVGVGPSLPWFWVRPEPTTPNFLAEDDVPEVALAFSADVPGRWALRLAPTVDAEQLAGLLQGEPAVADALWSAGGWVIVHLDDPASAREVLKSAGLLLAMERPDEVGLPEASGLQVKGGGNPDGAGEDPLLPKQWHLMDAGAPSLWESTPQGEGIVVAVLDTGIAPVPDLLPARLLKGTSFVRGEPTSVDHNGHGTHVAGTIAQRTYNAYGGAGMAPKVTLLPVKVLGREGFGESAWIAAGVDYAREQGAHVIHMSLGGLACSPLLYKAVRRAHAEGILLVGAAGNAGRKSAMCPGAWAEVVGVAAHDQSGKLAPYSNRGKGVEISAPGGYMPNGEAGGGVLQQTVDPSGAPVFRALQGTSMAAPHVSGVGAAWMSAGLSAGDVRHLLRLSATPGLSGVRWGRLGTDGGLTHLGRDAQPMRWILAVWSFLLLAARSRWAGWMTALGAGTAALAAAGLPGSLDAGFSWWSVGWLDVFTASWGLGLGPIGLVVVPLGVLLAGAVSVISRPTQAVVAGALIGLATSLVYGSLQGRWVVDGLFGPWVGQLRWLLVMAMVVMALLQVGFSRVELRDAR